MSIDKRPFIRWSKGTVNYVETQATLDDCERWVNDSRTYGWANLCGNRTRKVFTLDAEREGMDEPAILVALHSLPATCQRPSVNGGQHAVIEITEGEPMPTQVLARVNGVLLAEVRGVGHADSAGAYAVITGPGRGDLPADFAPARMTRAEADALLDPIRALHVPTEREQATQANRSKPTSRSGRGGGTGELIANAVLDGSLSWTQVLDDGWTIVDRLSTPSRVSLLRPRGAQESKADESANAVGAVLNVWSTSVDWACAGEAFNPPQALAASRFGGNYADAMRAVEEAASAFVTGDGTMPHWVRDWPTDLLVRIDEQRRAERDQWEEREGRKLREFLAPHMESAGKNATDTDETEDQAASTDQPETVEDAIFGATPILEYVRQLARAQMVSPYALLGSVLALVLADTPPFLRIPAYIGTPASLNSYFAIVGPSGSGKTVGIDVAAEALPRVEVTTRTPSSGEGIITLFVDVERGEQVQHTTNVLSVVDEIGTLGAQQDRSGSTFASILRSAWSGSTLSTNSADRTRRRHLNSHAYRFVMLMGVQPSTAHYLLDDQGAGTPQRIIWLPATDRKAPDVDVPRPAVNPLERWRRPSMGTEVTFPDCVPELVRKTRRDALRGAVGELDGHALLAREKLAAGLALLHSSTTVDETLWKVSGLIMRVSERTRQSLIDYRADEARKRLASQGRADAEREAAKASHAVERAVLVVARYVHRNHGGLTRRQVKDACGRWKPLANEAIAEAVSRGLVREEQVDHANGQQSGTRYFPGKVKP